MNESRDEQLDSLLNRWAERRTASEAHLQQLSERIVQAVDQSPTELISNPDHMDSHSRRSELRARALWFLGGVAVALLVMLSYLNWSGSRPAKISPTTSDEILLAASELGASQLQHQSQLLAEMQRIFNGQLEWVAENPGTVELGLSDIATKRDEGDQSSPFTIRVVVAKRTRGENRWTIAWTTNIVTKNERRIDLPIGTDGNARMQLWAFRLPDGMVAVDSQLESSPQLPVAASFGVVQKERTPQSVFETLVGDVEYKIIQTVATLGNSAI